MLIGRSIRKAFRKQQVLDGVDVSVAPGQITAIIGPSGGGKSTLVRALSLLDPPDSGTIVCDKREYVFPAGGSGDQVSQETPWPDLTVVFQQLFLWPHLTLRQNILLPLESRVSPLTPESVNTLIELFELAPIVDKYPNETSLGQRQRAALIRGLALKPRYLLLDEITSALDIEHVGRVLDTLKAARESGMAIMVVTHLIGFARESADHVVFIENGRVIEAGSPSILSRPETPRLAKFLSLVETAA